MLKKFFFLVLFFLSSSFADNIKINETLSSINANNSVKIYKDINGTLEAKDIVNAKTLNLKEEQLSSLSSLNNGIYWFRLNVENVSDKPIDWIFTLPRANVSGTLYLIHGNGSEEKTSISNSYVFLNHPAIAYPVNSQAKEKNILLLKISFEQDWFIFPQFDIVAKESFFKNTIANTAIRGITLGAMLILLTYNLFLFLSFKTRVYGWYCLYMFFVVLFVLANNGIGYQFLWKESNFITKNVFSIAYPLLFATALQFSKEFLKTKERFPFINKLLDIFSILFIVLLFIFMSGFRVDAIKIFSISSLVVSLLPFLGLYIWKKGYKEARFYTFAWSAWAIGMTPLILLPLGIQLDHESITFSARAGLVFESILLSFALADQINILRNQKEEAIEKYESQRTLLELHSRQAQMGEMISAITHQWKQPLNLIMIMLKEIQMTSSKAGEKISQEIDAEISNMKSVILAMSSTMDDFKNFFSPSKKKIVFSPILTIQNILSMFGKEYSHAGITFEISGSQELRVLGKENELKQVLLNLFNNSKDAFYSHNIKNRKIVVKVEKENKFLLIYIKDNASGISGDILGKIFEQHYTTKGDSGTGIGLYICKKIIEESFAGKITVKNIEGGVTFTIELPIAHQ